MIYFDNAATSRFKPRAVKKALRDSLARSANPGRGSHDDAIRGAATVEETRELLADYLSAKRANVIFTKNCTEALNLAILGTARPGGHVVTTALEHNSVLRPLNMLQKEGLISLTIIQPIKGKIDPESIRAAIKDKTYLVAVTAMSNVTGYSPPLEKIGEICAQEGVKLLVDGAQALGHRPLSFDEIGIDLLCGAGHKSLHGIMGTGFLIYGKHTFVTPLMYGGTGTDSANHYQPVLPPESLESGTLNLPGIAALKEGILWTKRHYKKNEMRIAEISFFLHQALNENGIQTFSVAGSPLVTFRLKGYGSAEVADILNEKYKIAVRAGLHCAPLIHHALGTEKEGLIRVSLGCENTMREAKRLLVSLREIAPSTK